MIPPIASNFVAGETASAAMDHVDDLNERGVHGILNLLGEHYDDRADADADTQAYVDLVRALAQRTTDACISVKPSQIGLDIGDAVFEENLARIVDAADCLVWIDMEDHTTTDVTLDAFERHARETGGNVGVCVQANLKRTRDDLERLADLPGKVRLVKGAYDEPAEIAYREKARVDEAYRDDLAFMFQHFDDGIAVGSHDPAMISYARELHEEYGTSYEVQMLTGVRERAQFDLADEVTVYQYIPYGEKWFSYFYRRIRERKSNALFALRAVVGR
ncbi:MULTISPECIES: proline dehydrogenase family protein [Haloarcula]|uniref:proline dehydrogenase n=1 Tax=Haloarcula pellucida TaxID=1427151 RepID=A0A830GLU7_9EURY|nr:MULTISPECIES: proline dehydrogenase family protein [Halomicroarcula]MBX0347915.1 proline dehydrogenase family protein [Halomicroarcula pellucida]MDS0279956.1 proline dehydrogenase family protein [Halomicroarcula sp. S1AR25-4]GGN96032.1 proline dehydrogenase [Halomicroarcula pellucida]